MGEFPPSTRTVSSKTVVLAMMAAQVCRERIAEGQNLHSSHLALIASVMGTPSEFCERRPESGFRAPTDPEQIVVAQDFLDDFLDDCRHLLRVTHG